MFDPSQEYFVVGVLSFVIGLLLRPMFAFLALKRTRAAFGFAIALIIACIILACAVAIFLLAFVDPGGKPTPELWERVMQFAVLFVLPLGVGMAIIELAIVPSHSPPP